MEMNSRNILKESPTGYYMKLESGSKRVFTSKPWITILTPAMNEQETIGMFIRSCRIGMERLDEYNYQILIPDYSTDKTAFIAKVVYGANVVKVSGPGLGRAYIEAIPHIKGKYVIMGDCDMTYDFQNIKPFVQALECGYDFVMGTRFPKAQPGSMPPLHRYFGIPLLTFAANRILGSRWSDSQCGMRAITREALYCMGLKSTGWEYASEMLRKAAEMKLRCKEVEIDFYSSPWRKSHFVRKGPLEPWRAGLRNLKALMR